MLRFLSRFRNSFTLSPRDTSASRSNSALFCQHRLSSGNKTGHSYVPGEKMPDSDDDSRTKRAKTEIRRYPVDPMSAPSTASARDSECGTGTSFLPPNRREAPRNGTENLAGQYPAGSISATVRQAPPPLLQGNRARRYSFLSPNRSTSPRSTRRNIVASSATTGEIRPITSSI